jgi:hypothetical protein
MVVWFFDIFVSGGLPAFGPGAFLFFPRLPVRGPAKRKRKDKE